MYPSQSSGEACGQPDLVTARSAEFCSCHLAAAAGHSDSGVHRNLAKFHYEGGSVAEWLACWTRAQKGRCSNRSRDAVG